jgi:transposase InsO family protein
MKSTKGPKRRRGRILAKAGPAAPKRRRRRIVAKAGPAAPKRRRGRIVAKAGGLTVTEVAELKDLRKQLQRTAGGRSPLRWNADPDEVQKSVAQLVLTLVEFVRKLLERQSIRRMEAGTLTDRQVEDVGRALMQLEATVRDIAAKFGVPPEDLNLELGPIGRLM